MFGLSRIMNYLVPDIIHKYVNKNQESCAVFQEFVVPTIDPAVDGYDLRGLTCRYCTTHTCSAAHASRAGDVPQ